jgi:hypothetical protein
MKGLLKADFKRVFKDKLLIVMGILAVVFALITPLLYALLFSGANEMVAGMVGGIVSAKSNFFASFSVGNNLGLIAPVLLAIVLCKDFSFGTVRNKIIAGKVLASLAGFYLSIAITPKNASVRKYESRKINVLKQRMVRKKVPSTAYIVSV